MFTENENYEQGEQMPETVITGNARIKVIGVGGAGNNAVNRMIDAGITNAEYVAVNTDAKVLLQSKAEKTIKIGPQLTKGLGAGSDPDIGRQAAEESKEELTRAIENTDLLFITAGMGGGTGTGAAPVIAKLAKDLKILTVAVVTKPFAFEGKYRTENALKGIKALSEYVDTIVIIPNEKIKEVIPKNTSVEDAFRVADEVLKQGIRGIADLITTTALINLDFADVRTILKDRGLAHMGVGVAKGENRIVDAVRLAVNSPLLETTIEGATGLILNITGGSDLTFGEIDLAASLISKVVDPMANFIFGACIDKNITDEVEVTVIATWSDKKDKSSRTSTQAGSYSMNDYLRQVRFSDGRDGNVPDILIRQPSAPVADPYGAPNAPQAPTPGYRYEAQQPADPAYGYGRPQQPVDPAYGYGRSQQPAAPAAPATPVAPPAPPATPAASDAPSGTEPPASPSMPSFFTRFTKKK